jgi:hypothetical protein
MYRSRMRCEVVYGHFADVLRVMEEVNVLVRDRGWSEATIWTPTVGKGNELISEVDYPDLATLEREGEAFYSDAEAMALWRKTSEHIVQGSVYTELLQPAPHLA